MPQKVFNLNKLSHYLYSGNGNLNNTAEFHGFFNLSYAKFLFFID